MSDQIVREWIRKAEEDWEAIQRLQAGDRDAVADVVGFLAQQTAEKYLKAGLTHFEVEPDRLHDLGALLDHLVEKLALCKLHHAAFDRHFVGIRPDFEVGSTPRLGNH